MTKEYGVTHFTELHRILHKYFLIWRCQMGNPLFQAIGGGMNPQFQNLVQRFQQFKRTFQGNPQQEVQKMLQSGRITQQQLNQAQAFAQQFQALMK